MSTPWRQRLVICIELHSARYTDPAPFQLPYPQQLTDVLTALAAVLRTRQPRNVPPLHTAQAVHEVVAEEYRILDSVNQQTVCASPKGTCSLLSLLAPVPSACQ